jgi:hypothetical protein
MLLASYEIHENPSSESETLRIGVTEFQPYFSYLFNDLEKSGTG